MNRFKELKDLLARYELDFIKFYEKGNKSAGTRIRKDMRELMRKAQDIRREILEMKMTSAAAPEEDDQSGTDDTGPRID